MSLHWKILTEIFVQKFVVYTCESFNHFIKTWGNIVAAIAPPANPVPAPHSSFKKKKNCQPMPQETSIMF